MTETHDTSPVFPPGRYGRRRRPRHRRWLSGVLAVLVGVLTIAVAVHLYHQYGRPDYTATVIGYTGITDTAVTVDFAVHVPPGGAAACYLRARANDGSVVGTARVTVHAPPGRESVRSTAVVTTTSRPRIGEVLRCVPAV